MTFHRTAFRRPNGLHVVIVAAAALCASPALAGSYPVAGKWTYDNVAGKGPAEVCGKRQMEFLGSQRRDTEGGVHDYRNLKIDNTGSNSWRITDDFFNGQAWGRVMFTLDRQDDDHIEIKMARGGKTFRLRRCQ